MKLNPNNRLVITALAGTCAAGAAAAITFAVAGPGSSQPARAQQVPVAATASLAQPTSTTPAPPPATTVAPAAAPAAPTSLTAAQATVIAERAASGHADQVDTLTGPSGLSYDVSVVRADGSEAAVTVDGRTGRVLSTTVEPADTADATEQPGVAEPIDPSEPQTPEPADTQDTQSNTD